MAPIPLETWHLFPLAPIPLGTYSPIAAVDIMKHGTYSPMQLYFGCQISQNLDREYPDLRKNFTELTRVNMAAQRETFISVSTSDLNKSILQSFEPFQIHLYHQKRKKERTLMERMGLDILDFELELFDGDVIGCIVGIPERSRVALRNIQKCPLVPYQNISLFMKDTSIHKKIPFSYFRAVFDFSAWLMAYNIVLENPAEEWNKVQNRVNEEGEILLKELTLNHNIIKGMVEFFPFFKREADSEHEILVQNQENILGSELEGYSESVTKYADFVLKNNIFSDQLASQCDLNRYANICRYIKNFELQSKTFGCYGWFFLAYSILTILQYRFKYI